MRTFFSILTLFVCFTSSGQFSPPKGFHVVYGENITGEDDVYTNGQYSFIIHKLHRVADFKTLNDSFKKRCFESFGFPFYFTRDTLCWGTGKHNGAFSYVVAGPNLEVIELYSYKKDTVFSYYSNWLLSTARRYKKIGRSLTFPMRGEKVNKQ